MTRRARGVLLTGATGLLGRYLLRDLLRAGDRVAVLAREAQGKSAAERVRELIDFWSDAVGRRLPEPVVLCGDVRAEGLGLTASDRRWLANGCNTVVHAAASLAFRASPDGEPWVTNVEGTRNLLNLCGRLSLMEFHLVSTAFVCGEATGPVLEDDRRPPGHFRNPYERSKWEAERLVRATPALRATVYRPSLIVGDSRTGYTSTYHGIYRFLQLADRLAECSRGVNAPGGPRALALRLPFTGDESHNLVPVDWVAGAIVRLMSRPTWHGYTYHLVAPHPTPVRLIKEAAQAVLDVEGVQFAGRENVNDYTHLEEFFLDLLEEYWPYFGNDPIFDARNLRAALPDLPPPRIDRAMLTRLFEFAVKVRRQPPRVCPGPAAAPSEKGDCPPILKGTVPFFGRIECRTYVEDIFPGAIRNSPLARAARLDVVVGLDVRGPGGGQWTFGWLGGDLAFVEHGLGQAADVVYRTDPATFADVVRGRQSPQEAFFARRIEVEGDVEKALKLAVLFGLFLAEEARELPRRKEVTDAVCGPV